jgi:hypothetical protein
VTKTCFVKKFYIKFAKLRRFCAEENQDGIEDSERGRWGGGGGLVMVTEWASTLKNVSAIYDKRP